LVFSCEGENLLGVLRPAGNAAGDPAGEASTLGVVVVVGGPQTRVGSHRQFVQLARALAAVGHPTLRFDVRGMGDSSGAQRTFEQISPDIGAAIDTLMTAQPQLRGVVLWGLCDGASAALLYLHDTTDARVLGLCLLNPWVRSEATQAQVQVRHYYAQRLLQPSFWRKVLGGGVGLKAVRGLMGSVGTLLGARNAAHRAAPTPAPATATASATALHYVDRMAAAWRGFGAPVLLQLSANDFTAREFEVAMNTHPAWKGAAKRANLTIRPIALADHTLSEAPGRLAAELQSTEWLRSLSNVPTPQPAMKHA
jgi:exosortase A-associated hydrolase 1